VLEDYIQVARVVLGRPLDPDVAEWFEGLNQDVLGGVGRDPAHEELRRQDLADVAPAKKIEKRLKF
jgi:hypothetical protein